MTAKKRRIDWDALRSRLSQPTGDADGDRLAAVYRQRAVELAARREQDHEQVVTVPVLTFRLGGERYGLALTGLAGVLPLERWTPVPGAPPELLGVINHKGQICSVLDLARLLGLATFPAEHAKESAYVLLLRRPGREVGLAVGSLEGLVRVPPGVGASEETAGPYLETLTPDRLRILSAQAILSHPVLSESPRP